jgi:hypothetical protein
MRWELSEGRKLVATYGDYGDTRNLLVINGGHHLGDAGRA